MKKIVPCEGWVVCVAFKSHERVTAGGLVVPSVSYADDQGVVESVGAGVTRCKPGDHVIYGRVRTQTGEQGEHRYLVEEKDILATVVGE